MPILHVPFDPDLHEAAKGRKGKRSWEAYIRALVQQDVESPVVAGPVVQGPAVPAATTVFDVAPNGTARLPAEPSSTSPAAFRSTSDELLREAGYPNYQDGIVLLASATLIGAAVVTPDGN
jgi:hypothetical protein